MFLQGSWSEKRVVQSCWKSPNMFRGNFKIFLVQERRVGVHSGGGDWSSVKGGPHITWGYSPVSVTCGGAVGSADGGWGGTSW
jgi:hypothetical protein